MTEPEHLRHLGVPVFGEDGRVERIEEKPEARQQFGVTGIYCYEPACSASSATSCRRVGGELEITDVNNHYVGKGQMAYDVLEGFWGDAGESIEAYYAVNDFVRRERRQPRRSAASAPGLSRAAVRPRGLRA